MNVATRRFSAADLNFNPARFPLGRLADFAREHWGVEGELTPLDGERDQNTQVHAADGASSRGEAAAPPAEDTGAVRRATRALRIDARLSTGVSQLSPKVNIGPPRLQAPLACHCSPQRHPNRRPVSRRRVVDHASCQYRVADVRGASMVPRSVVIVLAIGFVPALIFAWVFEITPDGLKRDSEVMPGTSIAPLTGRRMDRAIIAVLVLAVMYFGLDKFVLAPRRSATQVPATVNSTAEEPGTTEAPTITSQSIAVLPFENLSADPDNAFFADGIQDEILTGLAKIAGLKVISRTSTLRYQSRPPNLSEGVAARRSGDATYQIAMLVEPRGPGRRRAHAG